MKIITLFCFLWLALLACTPPAGVTKGTTAIKPAEPIPEWLRKLDTNYFGAASIYCDETKKTRYFLLKNEVIVEVSEQEYQAKFPHDYYSRWNYNVSE